MRVIALLLAGAGAAPALAQPAPAQVSAAQPVPGELEQLQLIWSTMAAVDQANRTGNYSVLRDLAAPGFQAVNDQARLTQLFAGLRASGVDLSVTLLATPVYRAPPRVEQGTLLRLQGRFALRPAAIDFELLYQWSGGRWRLFGVSIVPAAPIGATPARPAPPGR